MYPLVNKLLLLSSNKYLTYAENTKRLIAFQKALQIKNRKKLGVSILFYIAFFAF